MPTLDSTLLVSIAKQLNLLSVLAYLLPLLVCLWRWQLLPAAHRALILLALVTSLGLNVLAEVGRQVWHNNLLFISLGTWTETLFLSWAYYQAFHTRRNRRVLLAAVGVFILIALAEPLYWHSMAGGDSIYTRVGRSILLIGAALMYFEQILRELRNIRLEQDPMFLLSVGVTLYYSGTLMVFVLEDSMQRLHQTNQIWVMFIIESVLLILFNLLLTLALYHASRRNHPAPEPQPY
jgi:hypothetical protein